MSFEEEVVRDMEKWHGDEVYCKADQEALEAEPEKARKNPDVAGRLHGAG